MKKERLFYLDIVRTVAVICVFVIHFSKQFDYMGIDAHGFRILPDFICDVYLGSFGVSLFFIISGAALMYNYQEKCPVNIFYKKRFWGIYPMYWLAYILAFLYQFYFVNHGFTFTHPKWTFLLTLLAMDGNLSTLIPNYYILGEWFTGCIIFLYLLFPVLRIGIQKKPFITAVLILLVYVGCVFLFHTAMPTECLFLTRIPEFAAGMYFIQYVKKVRWPAALVSLGLLILCDVTDFAAGSRYLIGVPIVGMLAFLLLVYISEFLDFALMRKITSKIGKYCFSVFLVHHVVIAEVVKPFSLHALGRTETILLFLCCIFVTAILAWLLYRLNHFITTDIRSCFAKRVHK